MVAVTSKIDMADFPFVGPNSSPTRIIIDLSHHRKWQTSQASETSKSKWFLVYFLSIDTILLSVICGWQEYLMGAFCNCRNWPQHGILLSHPNVETSFKCKNSHVPAHRLVFQDAKMCSLSAYTHSYTFCPGEVPPPDPPASGQTLIWEVIPDAFKVLTSVQGVECALRNLCSWEFLELHPRLALNALQGGKGTVHARPFISALFSP
jgi:hypothetical protein